MAGLWVNECGNALDVELSAGVGEVEGRGRGCNDGLRFVRRTLQKLKAKSRMASESSSLSGQLPKVGCLGPG